MAHLGLSIEDSKHFDLETYIQIVELELQVIGVKSGTKKASQSDIDAFLI